MKVLYLTDSRKYNYHKKIIDDFLSVIPGEVMDLADDENDAMYGEIERTGADVIITFDCVGMSYRTVMDTLSFNNIYARFAHILFHKPDFYGSTVKQRQNLSMFMYIPNGEDAESCRRYCDEVPNISCFPPFRYKDDTDDARLSNRKSITIWWESFKNEAML